MPATPTRKSTLPQDLPFIKKVMEMFLVNDMNGAEEECRKQNSADQTLYIHTASSLMRSMRALMSFENDVCEAHIIILLEIFTCH